MSTASVAHDDEHLYAQAMAEIESGQTQPGLWAKAFADADGDESKAKARYLTLRVKALSAAPVQQAPVCAETTLVQPESEALVAEQLETVEETAARTPEPISPPAPPAGTPPMSWLVLVRHAAACLTLMFALVPGPSLRVGSPFWFTEKLGQAMAPFALAALILLFCSLFFTAAIQANGKRIFTRCLWGCALLGLVSSWYVHLNRAELDRMSSHSAEQNAAQTYEPIIEASAPAVEAAPAPSTPSASPSDRFKPVAGGAEIRDTKTGLIWRRCAEGMRWDGNTCAGKHDGYTFERAQQHAASEARSTGKPWLVPSKDELEGIVDKSQNPFIDPVAFPATPGDAFWSSSPYPGDAGLTWGVSFGNAYYGGRYDVLAVRLVRSGQ